jgi:hypothetical protein
MAHQRPVDDLDVERLLADWRWLCPQKLMLINRNAFGDMFLSDEEGRVFWLNVAVGCMSLIANCEAEFLKMSDDADKIQEWFAESDEQAAAKRGLIPGPCQCIGFSVPLVFAQSGSPETAYVADIYEHIGFLGDLHRQIATLPDGAKVRLRVTR